MWNISLDDHTSNLYRYVHIIVSAQVHMKSLKEKADYVVPVYNSNPVYGRKQDIICPQQ